MAGTLRRGSICIFLVCMTLQLFPEDRQQPEKTTFTYSIDVGLVVLPVTVLDESGRAVSGLSEKDFDVYEDGVRQQVRLFDQKDRPVAVGLILDSSSSMVPKQLEVGAAALKLAEFSNPDDQIFVVRFHDLIVFGLPLGQPFTSDIGELQKAISTHAGSGRTALYDAVISGLEHVRRSNLSKQVLVIMSDGEDNASRHTLEEAMDLAVRSNALIYTIGIYNRYDRDSAKVLKRLSGITGGEAFFPTNLSQLSAICKDIATDIRSQYTLGYSPSNRNRDGSYRSIHVSIDNSGRGRLTVRTRSGYRAPNDDREREEKETGQAGNR